MHNMQSIFCYQHVPLRLKKNKTKYSACLTILFQSSRMVSNIILLPMEFEIKEIFWFSVWHVWFLFFFFFFNPTHLHLSFSFSLPSRLCFLPGPSRVERAAPELELGHSGDGQSRRRCCPGRCLLLSEPGTPQLQFWYMLSLLLFLGGAFSLF